MSRPHPHGPSEDVGEASPPARGPGEETPPAVPQTAPGFTATYRKQMPLLIRFVMRLGADPHAAADAAHSAFTAACAQWEGIDNHGAWLRTVASRAYYRQRLCPETPVEALPERLQFYDDPVELGEQAAAVYSALAALPDRPRQVMAWHLDGYETGEIARRLGLTPAAVRQNLCRARERLRQLLGPLRGEQEGVPAP